MSVVSYSTIESIRAPSTFSSYEHPDYKYYRPEWNQIRDALAGERRIKDLGQDYLPSLDSTYGTEYDTYKNRAVYVNMVARTVQGMVGTLFRKNPKVTGVKIDDLNDISLDGLNLSMFAKKIAFELAAIGRIGLLTDMHDGGEPYITEYIAENILSWDYKIVKGRQVLNYVLLREIVNFTPKFGASTDSSATFFNGALVARLRILYLDDEGIYKQKLYTITDKDYHTSAPALQKYIDITPTKNGKTFDFIPFVIIGSTSVSPQVQRSPMYDITTLNLAHYRTSAQLEYGRHCTALPIYYAQIGPGEEQADYQIGPGVVWEVPTGQTPGILEFFGTGLKSLSDSLIEKEEHIAQLGGRIMGIRPQAVAESDNIFKMKQANEISILLGISTSLSAGLTQSVKWWLDWQRKDNKKVSIRINQDFNSLSLDARELRAVALLYQSGILPIQELFRVLQDSEFIDENTTLPEFQAMLDDSKNFPNQPDVSAMHEGYKNADSRTADKRNELERKQQEKLAEKQRDHAEDLTNIRGQQQSDLQSQMFEQGRITSQFENRAKKSP
jgi:hypothetical protein